MNTQPVILTPEQPLPQPAPPAAAGPPGLVSVLVPCCGQLEYTRLCVPSLLRHSSDPYELIFLDIGSLDGTAEYLAGVQAAARVRVEVVRTLTDLGIPAACREALARARGEFLVLLNNNTVVTSDWLNQLTALAGLSAEVGLVGPMSNHAAPPQLVEAVPYRLGPRRPAAAGELVPEIVVDVSALDRFAAEWRDKHRGDWLEVDHLGGFCLLVKREVLARLGLLDPRPADPPNPSAASRSSRPSEDTAGLGLFDTDRLCQQARRAGYRLACCGDLFLHHFGSRGFALGATRSER